MAKPGYSGFGRVRAVHGRAGGVEVVGLGERDPMEDGLEVIVSRSGGCVTVAARGEVDVATVDRFRRALRDAVYEAEEEVDLDLLEVTFMGSVGINTLVGARRFAIEEGVALKIVKSSRSVEQVLDVMNLTEFFV